LLITQPKANDIFHLETASESLRFIASLPANRRLSRNELRGH